MLEIVWDTRQFNNKAEWPADGSQPFVLSTGDNTGYGQHGTQNASLLNTCKTACLTTDRRLCFWLEGRLASEGHE